MIARNDEVVLGDGQGTTRATVDAVQAVTSTFTSDGFGNPVAQWDSSGNPYRYASAWGYRDDGDAGLLHVGARYYDPQVGRFISRDVVLSEHPYLYCEHEPIMGVDPSGRIAETIWDIGNIAYDIYTKDWGNLVFDVGAALIPFVPAGLGKATKVIKVFDDNQQALIDLAKWAKKRGASQKKQPIFCGSGQENTGSMNARILRMKEEG